MQKNEFFFVFGGVCAKKKSTCRCQQNDEIFSVIPWSSFWGDHNGSSMCGDGMKEWRGFKKSWWSMFPVQYLRAFRRKNPFPIKFQGWTILLGRSHPLLLPPKRQLWNADDDRWSKVVIWASICTNPQQGSVWHAQEGLFIGNPWWMSKPVVVDGRFAEIAHNLKKALQFSTT